MINIEEAKILALKKINPLISSLKTKVIILDDYTVTFDYGWVFFYQSEDFITKGDMYMLSGNAPILVDKYDSNIYITGTSKEVNEYIKIFSEFKKQWMK